MGRQIRLLKSVGVKEIVISTGYLNKQIVDSTKNIMDVKFTFIYNNLYRKTNSIYSLYLSKEKIKGDTIFMHGDLVFDSNILKKLIENKNENVGLINKRRKLPIKDFKARIKNNLIKEISINLFEKNCYSFQPLYKLSSNIVQKWFTKIEDKIKCGIKNIYAESVLNEILEGINFNVIDYDRNFVEEIDTQEDLSRVSSNFKEYDYRYQKIIKSSNYVREIKKFIQEKKLKNPLFVNSKYLLSDHVFSSFIEQKQFLSFSNYSPNPKYTEVIEGLQKFKTNNCDSIAIGGGSCIDVAKAIKIFSPYSENYINQKIYVELPLMAIPTTAGTGTRSTRFAVIYHNEEKQSLTHDCLLPDNVVLNPNFLESLPIYHKKSSLLDAFCQGVGSFWSIKSTVRSKKYSVKAINLILKYYQKYLNGEKVLIQKF